MSTLREHIERSERKTAWRDSPYPRTCEFLADIGIDPRSAPADSITYSGYDTFDRDAEGQRIYSDGELVRTRVEWPNPLLGLMALAFVRMDRAQGRAA